jgi:hypothetical protein
MMGCYHLQLALPDTEVHSSIHLPLHTITCTNAHRFSMYHLRLQDYSKPSSSASPTATLTQSRLHLLFYVTLHTYALCHLDLVLAGL